AFVAGYETAARAGRACYPLADGYHPHGVWGAVGGAVAVATYRGYDAEKRDHDAIEAVLNFDGVVRGRTLSFTTHGFDALADAAEQVGERFGHPVTTTPELGPHSDHWPYTQWGVPGYHVMSETGDEGRGWGHTFADTLDKLELRDFREQAILLTDLAVDLASDEFAVAHASPADLASQLEAEDKATGMKITGDWPYDE
ncbi:M28 family peptidase, partial [Salarchaeum sp. III]|uniref:M28 family peptidase n=1 Tax=Salarchaeum sp. III TaxID=3107927 RepID=UPI002EDA98FB